MSGKSPKLLKLAEMISGEECDAFLLLARKDEAKTREGKPYWRVTFRDATGEVNFPIWCDSALAEECRDHWQAGEFYKVRALFRATNFGPQLEIRKIRLTSEEDRADGFDPLACLPHSRFDSQAMFGELKELATGNIRDGNLQKLVDNLLAQHEYQLLDWPAADHHHNFRGGLLEHTLHTTRIALFLAEMYSHRYGERFTPLMADLTIAGAMLHDIGKLTELRATSGGAERTAAGELIGHTILGRDVVREAARDLDLDSETLLRLEHIILAHQRTAELGSPKPPMTPEALLVQFADDIDARLQMMFEAIAEDTGSGVVTSKRNALQQRVFK